MEYVDFEVEISARSARSFAIAVLRSPAGEPRGSLLPIDRRTLEFKLLALENALLRSGATRTRRIAPPDEAPVRSLGEELFRSLLNGDVLSCYQQSQRMVRERGQGLRLKLRVQVPELAALPWEFMYDPGEDEYVCLSRRTPIVRYLESRQPMQSLRVQLPLRILAMVASPQGLAALDTDAERRRLEQSLDELRTAGRVELTWLNGQTWSQLQDAIWRGPWHIFHFIGHGGFDAERDEGVLAFADEAGGKRLLTATELGRLLGDHDPLRLAVLNACEGARGGVRDVFSSTAATLVRRGVPGVVAMQYDISDGAAIQFGTCFYAALAHGLAVDAALSEARIGMSLATSETAEWGTPVLYMNAPDGRLFDLVDAPRPAPAAPADASRPDTAPAAPADASRPDAASRGNEPDPPLVPRAAAPEVPVTSHAASRAPREDGSRPGARLSPALPLADSGGAAAGVVFGTWAVFAFFIERTSYEQARMPFHVPSRLPVGIAGLEPSWVWALAGALSVGIVAAYAASRSTPGVAWLRVLAVGGLVGLACALVEVVATGLRQAAGLDSPRLITSGWSVPFTLLMLSAVVKALLVGALAGWLTGRWSSWLGVGPDRAGLWQAAAAGAWTGAAVQWGLAFAPLLVSAWLLAGLGLVWAAVRLRARSRVARPVT